jgi:hypothetical protein
MDRMREQVKAQSDEQLSLTDPDSRSMMLQAKGTGVVGYNVQTAVEAKHLLIVAHEVTSRAGTRVGLGVPHRSCFAGLANSGREGTACSLGHKHRKRIRTVHRCPVAGCRMRRNSARTDRKPPALS